MLRALRQRARTAAGFRRRAASTSTSVDVTPADGFNIEGTHREGRPLFLDMQSTTPVDPRVLDAMLPHLTWGFGNPHSTTHQYGWEAESAVEAGRGHVGDLVGASAKEIIFTSGATESNNMAVKGVANFYHPRKNHIITTVTEHKCILDSCRALQQQGFEVT